MRYLEEKKKVHMAQMIVDSRMNEKHYLSCEISCSSEMTKLQLYILNSYMAVTPFPDKGNGVWES